MCRSKCDALSITLRFLILLPGANPWQLVATMKHISGAEGEFLRSLVLMRVKNWCYRELRERIADGYTLRQFTDFYCQPVPRHDAFNRGFNRLTSKTLRTINALVVQAAVDLELEDGEKLRVDTTAVRTNIHHPTDNMLLWDLIRVVTRLVARLAAALERRRIKGFRDRPRSAGVGCRKSNE
jgi:transposase, IS5 family